MLVSYRTLAKAGFAHRSRPLVDERRQKFVNIDAMGSLLEILPPEMVQKCVEFLPFAEVHAEIKQVSKATRNVARRALTRGRWKPIRYVAEQGLAVCAADIDVASFFSRGLEAWSDPLLAARFLREYLWRFGSGEDVDFHDIMAHVWSDDWDDRAKAGVFLAEMGRIRAELHQQLAVDLAQQQWVEEGGSPDDYLDFISGGDY